MKPLVFFIALAFLTGCSQATNAPALSELLAIEQAERARLDDLKKECDGLMNDLETQLAKIHAQKAEFLDLRMAAGDSPKAQEAADGLSKNQSQISDLIKESESKFQKMIDEQKERLVQAEIAVEAARRK